MLKILLGYAHEFDIIFRFFMRLWEKLYFFVNNGKAKSADIEKLINKVKKKVNEKSGVNLELEIKIIGE